MSEHKAYVPPSALHIASAAKPRKFTAVIAQAFADLILAGTRAQVLQSFGYEVRTFTSRDQLANRLSGQVLRFAHRGAFPGKGGTRGDVCRLPHLSSWGANPSQGIESVASAADYEFKVENGPKELAQLLREIFDGR